MKRIVPIIVLCLSTLAAACGGDPSGAVDLEALRVVLAAAATATAQAGGAPASGGADVAATSASPAATPEATAAALGARGCVYDARFLVDVSVPDGTTFAPGEGFVKRWRFENAGDCPWTPGEVLLTHVGGSALAPAEGFALPEAAPGAVVDVAVPMAAPEEPGEYRSVWRAADREGAHFGAPVYAAIVVSADAPAASTPCTPAVRFVADVTVPDDTRLGAGEPFAKTWRLRNVGDCAWPEDTILRHVAGERLAPVAAALVGEVAAGETVDVSVPMTAPADAGTYASHWQVCTAGGECVAPPLYARIVVGKSVFGPVVKP